MSGIQAIPEMSSVHVVVVNSIDVSHRMHYDHIALSLQIPCI